MSQWIKLTTSIGNEIMINLDRIACIVDSPEGAILKSNGIQAFTLMESVAEILKLMEGGT